MNNSSLDLSIEQYAEYKKNGLLRLSLPSTSQVFLDGFLLEIALWLNHFAGIKVAATDIPTEIPKIAAKDRNLIALLYKVSRRFPSVKRLACDPWLANISARLMKTAFASCCPFTNVRIDLPGEDKYLLPLHQDFPYIQDSMNGITWWIPFMTVPISAGPPTFVCGSHNLGILRVKEFDYESTGQSGGKSFRIDNEEQFSNNVYAESIPVNFGEAIAFSTLLVHRSEFNLSKLARITLQLRFGDPFSQDSFDRNYPEGLYLGNSFYKSYPEFVIHD